MVLALFRVVLALEKLMDEKTSAIIRDYVKPDKMDDQKLLRLLADDCCVDLKSLEFNPPISIEMTPSLTLFVSELRIDLKSNADIDSEE